MSFILKDAANDDHDLQLNAWHWQTILALLDSLAVLPKEKIEVMGISGACPILSKEEAQEIAIALRDKIIPMFSPEDRVFIDGTVTKEPSDGTFYREPTEMHRNYSTNGAILRKLCAFCESCSGFVIY
jgi:hypothetical protein